MFSPFLFAATLCRTAISSLTDFVITAFDTHRLAVYYRVRDLISCTFLALCYCRSRDRHPLSTLLVRHLLIIHMTDHFILFDSKSLHLILIRTRRHEPGVFRLLTYSSYSDRSRHLMCSCKKRHMPRLRHMSIISLCVFKKKCRGSYQMSSPKEARY